MKAAIQVVAELEISNHLARKESISVDVNGLIALTGRSQHPDIAIDPARCPGHVEGL